MERSLDYYSHLSEEDLTELRYILQERYERALDFYKDIYDEWAIVMTALKHKIHARNGIVDVGPL